MCRKLTPHVMLSVSFKFHANLPASPRRLLELVFRAPVTLHWQVGCSTFIFISTELKGDSITHHASVCLHSMAILTANTSSLNPKFYWQECIVFQNNSTGVFSYSASLFVLFYTNTFELIVGIPLNIWLIFHILSKRCVCCFDFFFFLHLRVNIVIWLSDFCITAFHFKVQSCWDPPCRFLPLPPGHHASLILPVLACSYDQPLPLEE